MISRTRLVRLWGFWTVLFLCASLAEGEALAVRDSRSLACLLVVVLISASKLAHPDIKVATKWLKVQLTAVRPGSPWADSRPGVPSFRH